MELVCSQNFHSFLFNVPHVRKSPITSFNGLSRFMIFIISPQFPAFYIHRQEETSQDSDITFHVVCLKESLKNFQWAFLPQKNLHVGMIYATLTISPIHVVLPVKFEPRYSNLGKYAIFGTHMKYSIVSNL